MKINTKDALRDVHPSKVILPVLIGIAVAAYIFFREGEIESLSVIQPTWTVVFFLMVAILLVCFRILGYMIRLRILSEGKLSYFKILRIVLLWEFASAVTPSAVGGTSVALLFLYKEGLPIGKGAAVVLGTLFLDELYFVLVFPIVAMLIGFDNLFALSKVDAGSFLDNKYFYFAIAGYGVKVCIVLLVGYGLFFNPQALKRFILLIFSIPGLRRWKEKAAESGKPAEVQAKMVEGAVAKFAKDNALLSQLFVMDNKTPVAQVVEAAGKAAGTKIVLKDYVRFQLGEGIETEVSDFAAEVAAAAGLN